MLWFMCKQVIVINKLMNQINVNYSDLFVIVITDNLKDVVWISFFFFFFEFLTVGDNWPGLAFLAA